MSVYHCRSYYKAVRVCVYYCSTYYKAVMYVCLLLQYLLESCSREGVCVCLLLQDLLQSCSVCVLITAVPITKLFWDVIWMAALLSCTPSPLHFSPLHSFTPSLENPKP